MLNNPPLKLDKNSIQTFLTLLDEDAEIFCFQTFDDNKQRKDGKLAGIKTGSLDEVFSWLESQQNKGAGAFVAVNETDGKGRREENIKRIRAVFLEDDGDRPGENLPIDPHIIVETSPGKRHAYILTDGGQDFNGFDAAIQCMVDHHGGDPAAKGRNRVLRLPGTYHLKDPQSPHLVKIAHTSGELPLEWTEVCRLFPSTAEKIQFTKDQSIDHKEPKPPQVYTNFEIERYLRQYGLDDYDQWIKSGMALHHQFSGNPKGLELWDKISSEFDNYESGECEKKWATFTSDPEETNLFTFESIISLAKKPTYSELMDEIDQFSKKTAHELLHCVISDIKALPPIDKERCHKKIKEKTCITLKTIKEEESQITNNGDEEGDHLKYARATLEQIGVDNIIYSKGITRRYSNGLWRIMEDKEIKKQIHGVLVESGESVIAGTVNGILDVFLTEIYRDSSHTWNREKDCVNTLDGELFYSDGGVWELRPHTRENYSTSQLQINYERDATAPRFQQFLDEIFNGDPDIEQKKRLILEMIGYSLQAHCREEKFIILIGKGSNGKSVLMHVMESLVGSDNIAAVQPSELGNKFQRAHLTDKLLNVVTELKRGATMEDNAIKSLTSGETTTVERKNKDPYDMEPYATCWFGTNHMPRTNDFSDALFRRALIVPCNNQFPEGERDTKLFEKLKKELSGILLLALNAYSNVIATGKFTVPDSCQNALQQWRMEADHIEMFLEEELEKSPGNEITSAEIFSRYQQWCASAEITNILSQKKLTQRLTTRNWIYTTRSGKARMISGVQFKRASEDTNQGCSLFSIHS